MLSYSPWENLTRNILEMGGRRWSIHRSTQFPIDIECRLHVEPITDRQLGSHPPLAKTDLASTQIRRVSVTNHPERRDILHTKLPSLQTSHPELGFQSFSEYFYFITFFPICDVTDEVCGVLCLALLCPLHLPQFLLSDNTNIKTSFNSTRSRSLPRHHQNFFVKKQLYKSFRAIINRLEWWPLPPTSLVAC